jgi:hypothetical protein
LGRGEQALQQKRPLFFVRPILRLAPCHVFPNDEIRFIFSRPFSGVLFPISMLAKNGAQQPNGARERHGCAHLADGGVRSMSALGVGWLVFGHAVAPEKSPGRKRVRPGVGWEMGLQYCGKFPSSMRNAGYFPRSGRGVSSVIVWLCEHVLVRLEIWGSLCEKRFWLALYLQF